jgi:hypothetical protein
VIQFRKLQRQKSALGKKSRLLEKQYEPLAEKMEAAIKEHGGAKREIAVGRFRVRAKDGNRAPRWAQLFALHLGAARAKEIADATPPYVLLEVETV